MTVTINGTNDAPTITSAEAAAKGAVTEDASATLSRRRHAGDPGSRPDRHPHGDGGVEIVDVGRASAGFSEQHRARHFHDQSAVAENNTDTNTGATLGWHFRLGDNNAVLQSLAEGQTITQVYTVTFTDDHGAHVTQDVTVTITGTNDTPTITRSEAAGKRCSDRG